MRRLIIAGLVATFAAIPASAQSPRTQVRTVMRDGMECRERTQVKKDGRRSYDLKCKDVKHAKGHGRWDDERHDDRDDDRDDRRHDGRYDDRRYPSTLPDMIGGIVLGTGRRSPEAQRWLGTQHLTARRENLRDGRPERITWLDGSGRVVQRWIDTNRDGRADVVHIYRDGEVLRIVER